VANVSSSSYVFDKNLSIDEIIEDAYERIGMQGVSGYQLKTAKRSLNILFSEWGNRGLQFWEVKNQNVKLVDGQAVYTFFRSPSDGLSDGIATTLSAGINDSVTTIGVASVTGMSTSGIITINSEQISYTGISSLNLTGCTRGVNGSTAASHTSGDTVTQFPNGMTDIQEANYRIASTSVDTPMTKISRSQYQGFSNKTDKGLPSQYWVQRFIDKVTMTLYLTPGASEAGNFINFYYTKRIDDVGAYTNATDVPYRFVPCMISGLSYYLAVKYAPQRVQELKLLYEDELLRAEDEDGSSNSTYISPKIYYPGIG
jgi:hypothetical protein